MIYNYLFTGNPLFSIMESSFLNVAQKGLAAPFFPDQLAVMLFFLALVFILDFKKNLGLILSQSGVLSVLMFVISGIKETRFINLLTPAIAFNAALFAGKDKRKIVLLVVIFFLFMYFSPKPGHSELLMPSDSFIKDCRVASDEWVFFYNQGVVAECLYDITSWRAFVSSGGSIVLYNYSGQDLNSIGGEFIQREGYVIIKSSSCAPQPKKYISGSKRMEVLKWLRDTNSTFYDYSDWVE
jgi:hypothetical protein